MSTPQRVEPLQQQLSDIRTTDHSQAAAGTFYGPVTFGHIASERTEKPSKPSCIIPIAPDPDFIQRRELFDEIDKRASVPGARIALVGLGGVGKTQLAIAYASEVYTRSPQTWVVWIHASNAARFEQSAREVAEQLRIPGRNDAKANILQLLQTHLSDVDHGKWLMILDNADEVDFLLEPPDAGSETQTRKRRIDYLPGARHGTIVMTTRSKHEASKLVYQGNLVDIPPMDGEHAEALLERKLGQATDLSEYSLLANALDRMPLAITQAATYIGERRPRCTIRSYIDQLEASHESRTSLLNRNDQQPGRDWEAKTSILLTWQISFEHIHRERRSAADLLSLMSFYDRQAIPESLLRSQDKAAEEEASFEEDIVLLRKFSFISTSIDNHIWQMHRLVQDAAQMWLERHGRYTEIQERSIDRLNEVFPDKLLDNLQTCHALFPHVKRAAEQKPIGRTALLGWSATMHKGAFYALRKGLPAEALALATLDCDTSRSILGDDNKHMLRSQSMLASALKLAGRWNEALELEQKCLETRKRVLGVEHRDTLRSMNNLASKYINQRRWKDAEELLVQVIEGQERLLGAEHPGMLTSKNLLGLVLAGQGELDQAGELHMQILKIRKKLYGVEHPDTLASMHNLAVVYWRQERLEEAEEVQLQVLESSKRLLGEEHPRTLRVMNNLAMTYWHQRRLQEAQNLLRQAVEGSKRVLGEDHPDTLERCSELEQLYREDKGRETQQAADIDEPSRHQIQDSDAD